MFYLWTKRCGPGPTVPQRRGKGALARADARPAAVSTMGSSCSAAEPDTLGEHQFGGMQDIPLVSAEPTLRSPARRADEQQDSALLLTPPFLPPCLLPLPFIAWTPPGSHG